LNKRQVTRRVAAVVSALALLLQGSLPATAEDQYRYPVEQYVTGSADSDLAQGWRKIGIYETHKDTASTSWVFARRFDAGVVDWRLCDTPTTGFCAKDSGYSVLGDAILPPCEIAEQTNCIESLSVGTAGQVTQASLNRQIPGFSYEQEPSLGVPEGSTVSIWSAPNYPHTGGNEYAVIATLSWALVDGRTQLTNFAANVSGVTERPNPRVGISTPLAEGSVSGASGGSSECFYTLQQTCAYNQVLPDGARIRLAVRISKDMSGWLFGRLKDPQIQITEHRPRSNLVVIDAEPVKVPVLQVSWNQNEIPGLVNPTDTGNFGGGSFMTSSTDMRSFSFISSLREVAKDSSSGVRQFWGFQSSSWVNGVSAQCSRANTGLMGIVTTNAMAYQGGVPSFSRGTLSYRVAGMHYLPDGATEALGTYDLVMRSDIARCLYGFNRAPVSATITVTGEGDKNIATTVVGEKDGWLKLAAYGFTFSNKTIQVRLTQKRTTITCVSTTKPTKTRKVTGLAPKCPSGFRKR